MKKSNKGFTLVELLVVIGILGVLMASLFPAITGAITTANMSAMSMNGKKLYDGVIAANIDRTNNGRDSLWPKKNSSTSTSDSTDIASMTFSDADSYFDKLFDMENYGTQDWDSYLGEMDVTFVSAPGVPSYRGNKTLKGCVAWKVATDIRDDMPGVIPLLVSRNLDTSSFAMSGTTETSGNTKKLQLGKEFPAPFGNKGCVIIHKDGATTTHKSRYTTLSDIYKQQTITLVDGDQISYLSPSK